MRILAQASLLATSVLIGSNQTLAQDREIRVGIYDNPPKLSLGADGRPEGIFGDLLTEIATRENWRLRAVACTWADCLQALESGRIDLLPDVAKTAGRATRFSFHAQPALHSWSALYVTPEQALQSILDLAGQRVAVLDGSVQHDFLRGLFLDFGIEVELVPVSSFAAGFERVARGEADAAAVNRHFGAFYAARHGLSASPIVFQPAQLFFAAPPRASAELLQVIDGYLSTWLSEQGSPYYRVLDRWMGRPQAPTWPGWLGWAAAAALTMLLVVLAINAMLRRQVRAQTCRLEADLVRIREADAALSRQHGFFKSLIQTIPDLVWIKDPDGVYLGCNPSFERYCGVAESAIVGKTDYDLSDRATADECRRSDLAAIDAGGPAISEGPLTFAKDGYEGLFEITKTPMFDAEGGLIGVLGIAHDITGRVRKEKQIAHLAYHDQLTGLPNRALFLDRLGQALAVSRRGGRHGAVLFLDLDQFKRINDIHGHPIGDRVLQQVAGALRALLRQGDTLARFGGDEFVVLLPELPADRDAAAAVTMAVAEKVLAGLERPVCLDGHEHRATASIGITLFPQHGADADDLVRQADIAMYRAKSGGRNTLTFFEPHMQAQIAERHALERDLRNAVRNGELVLFLQSQVSASGDVVGAEALLRWQHPARGMLTPDAFIPLAEESGLIVEIGEWVLREACGLLACMTTAGVELRMAVNVSPRQFHQPDFVAQVARALDQSGAPAGRLTLEVTENLLMAHATEVVSRMQALARLGVRFAIDDFGIGYSSLAYLKRLPLEELKIDRSFVHGLPEDASNLALVETMLSMAQNLNFDVVAEGVEEQRQLERLAALGCRRFQGYCFARPEPCSVWLARHGSSATLSEPLTEA